jgi:hypothetical protein
MNTEGNWFAGAATETSPPEATFDLAADPAPSGPWTALGWLAFTVALLCSPVVVWAVWGALR